MTKKRKLTSPVDWLVWGAIIACILFMATFTGRAHAAAWDTPLPSYASPPCLAQLPGHMPPAFANPGMIRAARELCYPYMVILFSPLSRTPLWSAEWLTPARVRAARTMRRDNVFHPDPLIPPPVGAALADYVRSGYDRGHLSPSGDQPTPAAQADSFTLANMAPQNPGLNRGPWADLEDAVRDYAEHAPVFVVTGLQYIGSTVTVLNHRVAVPTTYYKMIYDPAAHTAVVYVAPNRQGGRPQPVPLAEFQRSAGIDFHTGRVGLLSLDIHRHTQYTSRMRPASASAARPHATNWGHVAVEGAYAAYTAEKLLRYSTHHRHHRP